MCIFLLIYLSEMNPVIFNKYYPGQTTVLKVEWRFFSFLYQLWIEWFPVILSFQTLFQLLMGISCGFSSIYLPAVLDKQSREVSHSCCSFRYNTSNSAATVIHLQIVIESHAFNSYSIFCLKLPKKVSIYIVSF